MELTGNVSGMINLGGGGESTVEVTPILTSGEHIADIEVDGVKSELYAPEPTEPTEVEVTPIITSGDHIADIEVNGVTSELYAPEAAEVEVTPILTSGEHIADIEVDGETWELYAPESGATVYAGDGVPQVDLGVNGDIYVKVIGAETDTDILLTDVVVNQNNTYMSFTIDLGEASALVIETTWGTFVKNIVDIPAFADNYETKSNIWVQSAYYSCGVSRSGDIFYFYVKTPSGNTNQYIQSVSKRIITIEPSNVDSLYFKISNRWVEYNPS